MDKDFEICKWCGHEFQTTPGFYDFCSIDCEIKYDDEMYKNSYEDFDNLDETTEDTY